MFFFKSVRFDVKIHQNPPDAFQAVFSLLGFGGFFSAELALSQEWPSQNILLS
jgi:hypothetical protein